MNLAIGQQFRHALPPLFAPHDIDNGRARFFQRLRDMPRDALLIRDAKYNQRFAGQAEEIIHACCFARVTAKPSVTAAFPSHVTLPERKNASPIRSSRVTSSSTVSPGRTIRLNFTSFSRPATGTPLPVTC